MVCQGHLASNDRRGPMSFPVPHGCAQCRPDYNLSLAGAMPHNCEQYQPHLYPSLSGAISHTCEQYRPQLYPSLSGAISHNCEQYRPHLYPSLSGIIPSHWRVHHVLGNAYPTADTCFPLGKLTIAAIKTRDTRGDEYVIRTPGRRGDLHIGKADPYVKIKLGGKNLGKETKSTVHWNAGSTPYWNQMFSYYIKQHSDEYNVLRITLMNKNGHLRKDNSLGEICIVNMAAYVTGHKNNNVTEKWYPIYRNREGKILQEGEILLGFHFVPMTENELLAVDGLDLVVGSSSGIHNGYSNVQANIQIFFGAAQVILGTMSLIAAIIAL